VVLLLFAAAPASGQKVTISNTVIVAADVFAQHNGDRYTYYIADIGMLKVGKFLGEPVQGTGDQHVTSIAYLKFFLKSLPQNPINYFPLYGSNYTATLRLYASSPFHYSPKDLYIYGITTVDVSPVPGRGDDWQEGNIYGNPPLPPPPPWYTPDHNYMNWWAQHLGPPVLLGVIPKEAFSEGWGFVSCSLNMDWILDEWNDDKVLTLKLMVSDEEDYGDGKMNFYSKDWLSDPSPTRFPQLILTYDSFLYDAVIIPIQDLQHNTISNLDSTVFKNSTMKHAMINKLSSVAANIEAGNYQEALGQLKNDLLAKTDGCHNSGAPDKNDWIKDCATQSQVHAELDNIIKIVQQMQ
jgi:hypothetical protein